MNTEGSTTGAHEFVASKRANLYPRGYHRCLQCDRRRDEHDAAPIHRTSAPAEPKYVTSKEDCERNIKGVCEGCGGPLTAIETVDNSGRPTYWQGCEHCSCFRSGVERKYFEIARKLVEGREIVPYSHMCRVEYENTPERLDYFFDSQTAGLSHLIRRIHKLLEPVSDTPAPSEAREVPEPVTQKESFAQIVRATISPLKGVVADELYRDIFIRVLALYTTTKALNRSTHESEVEKLREALRASAEMLHKVGRALGHKQSFEECDKASCAAARAALPSVEGEE